MNLHELLIVQPTFEEAYREALRVAPVGAWSMTRVAMSAGLAGLRLSRVGVVVGAERAPTDPWDAPLEAWSVGRWAVTAGEALAALGEDDPTPVNVARVSTALERLGYVPRQARIPFTREVAVVFFRDQPAADGVGG